MESELEKSRGTSSFNDSSYAKQLMNRGSSPDAVNHHTGNSLLHISAEEGFEAAGIFLASHGADPNRMNQRGETPLHITAAKGLAQLTAVLLTKGGNPNAQMHRDPSVSLDVDADMEELSSLTDKVKCLSREDSIVGTGLSPVQSEDFQIQFDLPRPNAIAMTSTNPFDFGEMAQAVASLNPFDSPITARASNNPFDSPVTSPVVAQREKHESRNLLPDKKEPLPIHQSQQTLDGDPRMAMVNHLSTVVKGIPRLHSSCKAPLHLAVQNKHQKVVEVLLQHKGNDVLFFYVCESICICMFTCFFIWLVYQLALQANLSNSL